MPQSKNWFMGEAKCQKTKIVQRPLSVA